MTYFSSKEEINKKELAAISLLWSITAAGLASLVLVFFLKNVLLPIPGNNPVYSFLFISGTLFITYFSGLFFAQRQFSYPHLIPAIVNILVTIFYAWLLIADRKDEVQLAIIIYFGGFMTSGILLGALYYQKYNVPFLLQFPTSHTIKKLLQYSAIALLANVVSFLAYRIDYWILKSLSPKFVSHGGLGNYIQVGKLVQLFLFAPTVVAAIAFPISAAAVDPNFKHTLKRTTWRVLFLNGFACFALVVMGKWLFTFLYGDSFSQMYECFLYSIPAILSISITRILASYFAGTNRIRYNLIGGLIALVSVATLNFLLIPKMGINGAALADSIGYMLLMIFLLTLFQLKDRNVI